MTGLVEIFDKISLKKDLVQMKKIGGKLFAFN